MTRRHASLDTSSDVHDVVVVGGGAAGIAVAASLLRRAPDLDVVVVDPSDVHCYQPGWTMVGAGVFQAAATIRTMSRVLPRGARWIQGAVESFELERHTVVLSDRRTVAYRQLVVCPGLELDWNGVEGLVETLGRNGVTSNYRIDLAPYTWRLVQQLRGGRAVFTQPSMPIKCAGAPQKAMYLSADRWRRDGRLARIDIEFFSAASVLFSVADYVPALMEYVQRYGARLNFDHRLISVDGDSRTATFTRTGPDGVETRVSREFEMLHAVPPQRPPSFIRSSPLADAAGWLDVDPTTLRHRRWEGVHALGDVAGTPNAKTAAAARKQAPVVAHNVLTALDPRLHKRPLARYDGYGACPLTVEVGKVVLAEFSYGGKLSPTLPRWLNDGTHASRLAWWLKSRMLPPLYWQAMLKGREWLTSPSAMQA